MNRNTILLPRVFICCRIYRNIRNVRFSRILNLHTTEHETRKNFPQNKQEDTHTSHKNMRTIKPSSTGLNAWAYWILQKFRFSVSLQQESTIWFCLKYGLCAVSAKPYNWKSFLGIITQYINSLAGNVEYKILTCTEVRARNRKPL